MTLNSYQKLSRQFAIYGKPKKWKVKRELVYAILALAGESGELANKLKKYLRAGTEADYAVLTDELGDVLWYSAKVAQECDTTLKAVAKQNLKKLKDRAKIRKAVD